MQYFEVTPCSCALQKAKLCLPHMSDYIPEEKCISAFGVLTSDNLISLDIHETAHFLGVMLQTMLCSTQ